MFVILEPHFFLSKFLRVFVSWKTRKRSYLNLFVNVNPGISPFPNHEPKSVSYNINFTMGLVQFVWDIPVHMKVKKAVVKGVLC